MSHLWEKEKEARGERRREGGEKGMEEERKKGRRNEKIGGKIRRRDFIKN